MAVGKTLSYLFPIDQIRFRLMKTLKIEGCHQKGSLRLPLLIFFRNFVS